MCPLLCVWRVLVQCKLNVHLSIDHSVAYLHKLEIGNPILILLIMFKLTCVASNLIETIMNHYHLSIDNIRIHVFSFTFVCNPCYIFAQQRSFGHLCCQVQWRFHPYLYNLLHFWWEGWDNIISKNVFFLIVCLFLFPNIARCMLKHKCIFFHLKSFLISFK